MSRFDTLRKACFILFPLLLIGLLVCDRASARAAGGAGEPRLFPEMAGWKPAAEIQAFSSATLYDYINGAADLYLKYDFQELKVAEYQNDRKASVTIEVYRHKTPLHAFGIYSQERLGEANYLEIGTQGYSEKGVLNFIAADRYVKMAGIDIGPGEQELLLAFAGKIVTALGGNEKLPAVLAAFPGEGKQKNSEKFIAREFLGYPFFHSGFTADYRIGNRKFTLFLLTGSDRQQCRAMIAAYLKQTGNLRDTIEEGRFQLQDPYHGQMDFYWKGNWIWGALDLDDPALRTRFLQLFAAELEKRR